jgi:hypothetical protein
MSDGLMFVSIKEEEKGVELKFLVDTGATFSVLRSKYVSKAAKVIPIKSKVQGIAGSLNTEGKIKLKLCLGKFIETHEFHILENIPLEAHGILGATFFEKFRAIINYETLNMAISIQSEKVLLPLWAKKRFKINLTARTESFQCCFTNATEESVILPEEITEGVFLAGALVLPREGKIFVKILNTREENVEISNYFPKLVTTGEYVKHDFSPVGVSKARIEELLKTLDMEGLNTEEDKAIRVICSKFSDIFHLKNDKFTHTHIYKQSIALKPNAQSVFMNPYRIPHSQKEEVKKQVDEMIKNDIIENATSEWSSPILLVPKKPDAEGNKKWRLVIDYRRLNEKIQDEKFPLANIADILDSLAGTVYFSTLDLSQGYYQLEIREEDRPCTAFVTETGQFQMKKLPMGLKISPSAFSRMMTIAMSGLNYEKCFVYLDDLIVFGKNMTEHNKNLISVFTRMREVNLKLNPSKCKFLRKSVLYLGHQISENGILPDPAKIDVVKNYPCPKDEKETKRFVAFANYYRKFIKNFAVIAAPLNKLSKKGVSFLWSEECQKAFDVLKNKLCSPVVLDYPDFSEENNFNLTTDASKIAIGAVLSNSNGRPVAYASRALNKQEKNYSTTEIELLAMVWATKHFRPYLFGRYFEICTDHRPLVYLFSQADPSSRLNKFRMSLMEYNFVAKYLKGKDNSVADALSRISIEKLKDLYEHVSKSRILVMTRYQKRIQEQKAQENEGLVEKRTDHPTAKPTFSEILKRPKGAIEIKVITKTEEYELRDYDKVTIKRETVFYVDKLQTLFVKRPKSEADLDFESILQDMVKLCKEVKIKELVLFNNENNRKLLRALKCIKGLLEKEKMKISILQGVQRIDNLETRKLILQDFHLLPSSAHAGISRMTKNIRKYYYWSGLTNEVKQFVSKCAECQKFKHSIPSKEPMVITSTSTKVMSKIFLDIVGSIQTDDMGYSYILTMQCELSKYVVAVPLKNKEAATVARAFVENFILKYGIPKAIATDCGTEFLAEVMKKTCALLHVDQLQSTAYHHRSIGALENSHKNLGAFLRTQVAKHNSAWSSWVPYWCFAFNTTTHTETKYSPFELVFGKICVLPSNIATVQDIVDPLYNVDDYVCELKYRLQCAHKDAHENLEKSKIKRKNIYDLSVRIKTYQPGDLVLLKNEQRKKLDPIFNGPFKVLEEKGPNVELEINNKKQVVHKDRVKPYIFYIS